VSRSTLFLLRLGVLVPFVYYGIQAAAAPFFPNFSFVGTSHGYPPYHMWVTADRHYVFVRATLGGDDPQQFDLVEFNQTDA